MKKCLCLAVLFLACLAHAQTNAIRSVLLSTNPPVLDRLYSMTNTCLMTNAEYRGSFGVKLMFKTGTHLEGYNFYDLSPSAILALKVDVNQLRQHQDKLDAENARWRQNDAQWKAMFFSNSIKTMEAQQKAQAEYERQEAILKRQAWEDALKAQAVENERIKAQAALIQAQNPTQIIINNQAVSTR